MRKLRPNKERSRTAIIFMWIATVFTLLLLLAEINQIFIIKEMADFGLLSNGMLERVEQSDSIMNIMAVIHVIIRIICAIVFIMWFRRAYFNLHSIGAKGLRTSEGWASGAWFIPIYNWWGPFNVATDLFTSTENILVKNDLTEPKQSRHDIKGYWWVFWIIGSISASIGQRMSQGDNIDTILTGCYIGAFSSVCVIVAGLFAVKVISNYSEMEELLPKVDREGDFSFSGDSDLLDD